MNNEKRMREKAEQMAKNAEMKIQKAQLKEQKYQQDLEFQKKNNPNFRDYDKEPLIIQSYEKFFVLTLFLSSLMFSGVFYWLVKDLYDGVNLQYSNFWKFGIFPTIYIIIVAIFQKFKFKNHTIKFTNKYIEFYDDGKLKRQCEIIYDELARPFFTSWSGKWKRKWTDLFCIVIFIYASFVDLWFIVLVLSFYFSNFLIKLFFYFFINFGLIGFKIFPFIWITKKTYTVPNAYSGIGLTARYFMIYLHNDEVYKEIKKYFLQKNINIDDLPKKYNFI